MKFPPADRVLSIDAYRGLVMLAMVSGGFGFAATVESHPALLEGTHARWWQMAARQFEHVPWAGCAFWDLIQPSFMFLVGVSLPFSSRARQNRGTSAAALFWHALIRSLVLIALGVIIYSQQDGFLNAKFVNVLTQIGLGYMFVYVLRNRSLRTQLLAITVILAGCWFAFFQYTPSEAEQAEVAQYLAERTNLPPDDLQQYTDHRRHWNKHVNAAAAFDRWFLNLFPRNEEPWHGRGFWINHGGYQTLNFVPSVATMIFGLIAGLILIEDTPNRRKLGKLLGFSAGCFAIALALDTELWPIAIDGWSWSVCPIVKRIWTPAWTLFSAGWTFALMAAFFLIVDYARLRLWTFPLAIVGMNSIVMYLMAQLTQGWFSRMLSNTLRTVDAMTGTAWHPVLYGDGRYVAIWHSVAMLGILWLACLWLYRRRLFVRL